MRRVVVVLCLLFISFGSQETCSKCFQNSGRKFQCHCVDQCDSNGRCIGNSSDCASGWFGFRCQYQNMLYYYVRGIVPSSAFGLLRDAQNNQCNNDSTLQYLSVTWNISLPFTWLRLKLADKENLRNFNLTFLPTNTNVGTSCINQTLFQVDETTFDIHCDLNEATIQFKLEGLIVGSICSVKVSGGRNVALFQNTSQSSNYAADPAYFSEEAVDGDVLNDCSMNGCSHTADGDNHPFWSVIFDKPYVVKRFTIFNRIDIVPDRLKHFELEALNEKSTTIFYYKDPQDSTQQVFTVLYLDRSLVYGVRINQTQAYYNFDKNPYVSINEFQAFGECSPGYWGLNCQHQCTSPCTDICSTDNGSCYLGCLGYSDPPICSKACTQGYYGINCTETCASNCLNQSCSSTSGFCYLCKPGYLGKSCEEQCQNNSWGNNCTSQCSIHCLNGLCDTQTGDCTFGCKVGFQLPDCLQICKEGQYGRNCSFKCSDNCTDYKCNVVDGSCFTCLPGLHGTFCEKSCDKYHFGLNCSQLCSNQCLAATCKSDSGECDSCIPGYHGDYCNIIYVNTEENYWQTYFGIGFAAGLGSILAVLVTLFLIIYLRRTRLNRRNVMKSKDQVYNQPDVFNMDKHKYETFCKPLENGDKHYEEIEQTVEIGC